MKMIVTLTKPENFTAHVDVGGVIIEVGDELVILKRAAGTPYEGTWCLPAGKIEVGETILDGTIREVFEETTITITPPLELVEIFYVQALAINYRFHTYVTKLPDKPPIHIRPDEHTDYQWVTLTQALTMPLIPGGVEVFDAYSSKLSNP